MIAWIAAEEASFVNGASIPVAGGFDDPVAISRILSLSAGPAA